MLSALSYYLALPFIYAISLLPFPLLYRLSDGLYLLLFRVVKYRRKVVMTNLRRSFPEKTDEELQAISRSFYRHLADLTLETLKTLTISPKQLRKHVTLGDCSALEHYHRQNQSVILVMGHYGNWELAGARFALEPLHTLYVIYHPLRNARFEQLFFRMRTRLGNRLYPMKSALRGIMRDRGRLTATAFIADQSPPASGAYWTRFLNQDTAIFTGTEKIARKMGYPVIYVSVKRPRRGLYYVDTEVLSDDPAGTAENDISEWQTRRLERDIIERPEFWLWTHRRWKRQPERGERKENA